METSTHIRLAHEADVPALRRLVNAAYKELGDLGLNFTGTYQDEEITRERMKGCDVLLLFRGDALAASIALSIRDACYYVNQLAVRPDLKRQGLGSALLDLAEERARALGLSRMRLDTAVPAVHLVEMYRRRGYREVDEVQWEGKTYRSYIMEKELE